MKDYPSHSGFLALLEHMAVYVSQKADFRQRSSEAICFMLYEMANHDLDILCNYASFVCKLAKVSMACLQKRKICNIIK